VGQFAREELRHRRGLREVTSLVFLPRRFPDENTSGLDLGRHVDELLLHRLELPDRLPELPALVGVGECEVVAALREPDTHRGHRDAAAVEDLQELLEALSARAEQVRLRHAHALERQLARVGRAPAELLHRLGDHVARGAVRDDDVGDLALAGDRRDRHARGDVCPGIRDEHLRAVDDPFAVLEPRGRSRRAGVGACVRLGQPERRKLPAGSKAGKPLAPLLLVPEVVDRQGAEGVVRGERDRDRRVDARQFLDDDRVRERVGACAAVLLGDCHTHQAELGELRRQLVGEAFLAVEFLGDGRHLLQRELSDRVADQLVLAVEIEVHRAKLAAKLDEGARSCEELQGLRRIP